MRRIPPFAALVLAATLSTAPTHATASDQARQGEACAQVFIVGIGGSGEPTASNPSGRTVGAAVSALAEATGASTASRAVAWRPARAIPGTLRTTGRGWRSPYLRGARSAASTAVSALTQRAVDCPDEAIALVGYAQGALVTRLVLRSLTAKQGIADRVRAVGLISDPVVTSKDKVTQVGTAPSRHRGIVATTSRTVTRTARIAQRWRASVTSVCGKGDIVCDSRRAGVPRHADDWRAVIARHRAYAEADRDDLGRAARLLVADLGVPASGPPPDQAEDVSHETTDEMIRQIDLVRASGATCGTTAYAPAPPVIRVPLLDQVSQSYATRMAEENFFGHVSPDGDDPSERAQAAGYPHLVAENIAAGQTTAASAVAAWRDSPGHCTILMTSREVGVGHAENSASDYVHYWTLMARYRG